MAEAAVRRFLRQRAVFVTQTSSSYLWASFGVRLEFGLDARFRLLVDEDVEKIAFEQGSGPAIPTFHFADRLALWSWDNGSRVVYVVSMLHPTESLDWIEQLRWRVDEP